MSTNRVAEFEHVSKNYPLGMLRRGVLSAVRDVTFHIEAGEIFGLLGPNRAGKTTLVKMLLSLCRPTSGNILRLGRPISDRSTLGRIGYVHESQAFPGYLSAAGLLEYYGALAYISEPEIKQRVPKLLELVGLADRAREPIARFSKGMTQRLGLAQALLNDPDLLVLDEPTEGLDLTARRLVQAVLADRRKQGRSVLLISHLTGDVEQLCDRAAVIVGGRPAHVGPLTDLTRDPATGSHRPLETALHELYERNAA